MYQIKKCVFRQITQSFSHENELNTIKTHHVVRFYGVQINGRYMMHNISRVKSIISAQRIGMSLVQTCGYKVEKHSLWELKQSLNLIDFIPIKLKQFLH